MAQWYLSYEGQQSGPYDLAQAQAQAQANPNGYVWREGFAEWLPIGQVGELTQTATPAMTPPPSGHEVGGRNRLQDHRPRDAVRGG